MDAKKPPESGQAGGKGLGNAATIRTGKRVARAAWYACVVCGYSIADSTSLLAVDWPRHLHAFCPYCVENWARTNKVPLMLPVQE